MTISPSQLSLFPHLKQKEALEPAPVALTPSTLPVVPELFLDVSEDCQTLSAYRVPFGRAVHSSADLDPKDLDPIATYPSMGLLYPDVYIGRKLLAEDATRLITLYGRGRRFTRFQGVTCGWDQSVDRRVWTTNIDTVIFLRTLKELGLLTDPSLKRVAEVGVGGGHISTSFAKYAPHLSALYFTDIMATALQCTLRNVDAYAGPNLDRHPLLGKGIRGLPDDLDLLVCNPPYIPIAPHQEQNENDPYRGTGLIRELIALGPEKTKRVLLSTSGMSLPDVLRYAEEHGRQIIFHSESPPIPLKIENIDKAWAKWLVELGGLEERDPETHYYRYWHKIYTIEIKAGGNP